MSKPSPKETILSFNCFYYEVISCKKDNPMRASYHRHDISDETWPLLENHLPGAKELGEETPETTVSLSTQFSGF